MYLLSLYILDCKNISRGYKDPLELTAQQDGFDGKK